MSTGNFSPMPDGFDLIVFRDDFDGTIEEARLSYKECHDYSDEEMADITNEEVLEWADEGEKIWAEDTANEIQKKLDDFNYDLKFYKVVFKSGYYSGAQFYVVEKDWYLDVYGAALCSMQNKEIRIINEWMRKIGAEYGGYCASVSYRFSNGETGYNLEPLN